MNVLRPWLKEIVSKQLDIVLAELDKNFLASLDLPQGMRAALYPNPQSGPTPDAPLIDTVRHEQREVTRVVGVENVQMSINDAKPRRRRGALALDSEPASRGQRCRSES